MLLLPLSSAIYMYYTKEAEKGQAQNMASYWQKKTSREIHTSGKILVLSVI